MLENQQTPPDGGLQDSTPNAPQTGVCRLQPLRVAIIVTVLTAAIGAAAWVYHVQTNSGAISTDIAGSVPDTETLHETRPPVEAPSAIASAIADLPYSAVQVTIAPELAQDFSIDEIQNIDEMAQAYGVTFTEADRAQLAQHKFVIKNLMDTNLSPVSTGEWGREIPMLYDIVSGPDVYMERTQANSVFYTADAAMNLFSILSVELMKETENTNLFPLVRDMTASLYAAANERVRETTGETQTEWTTVRNYLAVPHALLSTVAKQSSPNDFKDASGYEREEQYQEYMATTDKEADTLAKATAFVQALMLDAPSTEAILADLSQIFEAPAKAPVHVIPDDVSSADITLLIPFSQFTVRGSYTSSSLRRQYFRAVQWYQQIPFYLKSDTHTRVALHIAELMETKPQLLEQYTLLSDLLTLLVGPSDDLDVRDYVAARRTLADKRTDLDAIRSFLREYRAPSLIKAMPAEYGTMNAVDEADVLEATRGMRFFSQKFIPDSYWTGELTQGDEAPAVDGKYRLPVMASSLEVMSLLGSKAAREALPQLSFYNEEYKPGIDIQLGRLAQEAQGWSEEYWRGNQVTGILWTINGLFTWYEKERASLPKFMQSPLWDTKTLLTGSGFWTEMRHTNILYAKQSFAERGGGGGDTCEDLPEPARGYIEPQPEAYARLLHVARLLQRTYAELGFTTQNAERLDTYIEMLEMLQKYSTLQLNNTSFTEQTQEQEIKYAEQPCTAKRLAEGSTSEWEEIRTQLADLMQGAQPIPVEGSVVPLKDKRAAVIADVHTAYGSTYLEEGTGVPRVIFVAVKDVNGPRLTVGFTYSHYEFTSDKRLTDEEWQERFYTGDPDDSFSPIEHKPKETWPALPTWYQPLLGER